MDMQSFALGQRPTVQKPGLDPRCPHEHGIKRYFCFQVDLIGWQEAAQGLLHLVQKLPHLLKIKLRPLDQIVSRYH